MDGTAPPWVKRVVDARIFAVPPYVAGKPVAELQRELGVTHAIKMASNENPLGPSPLAVQAVRESLQELHVYPESSAPELRSALAERTGVSPDSVILGNGSDELMEMCAHVFIGPGCEAIMGEISFSMYRICVEAFGGAAVRVPLKDYAMDLPAMARAVTERTRIIFLAIPNSPTGTIVSRADFESFLADLPKERLLLVVDEAYREYVAAADCPCGTNYVAMEIPVLVLRTFSKIYGLAGLRVGYGIGAPWLVELLNRIKPPFNVNSLAQKAALAALDDRDHLERSLQTNREGMRYLSEELASLGVKVVPSHANFLTFCLGRPARGTYEALLRRGVIVRHLGSFGLDDCIRVTVGKPEDNRRFIEALRQVLKAAS
ncbi:MAG: histidinol-phosphate transaminase [Desulfomonile tiedjei]|nr:histidinol-phosphate transaminase [Desulfomonile tiedjei]